MGIKCSEKCLGYLHSEVDYHVFIIIVPLKWPLYPKCVATIGGLFKLEMIRKDSVPAKVATVSEWPLYP